jgi:hypothetical protein
LDREQIASPQVQAHLQFAQANAQAKNCKRASTSPTKEKLFFKIPFPSKIFKTVTAQPTPS